MTEAERSSLTLDRNEIERVNGVDDLTAIHQDLTDLLKAVRRHLHGNPEVGFEEHQTARFIREMLEMHGLANAVSLAGTGLYVDVVGYKPGPHVGFRADIDALAAQDRKEVDYRSSIDGVAHLCGHDAHTAVAVGVAILLNGLKRHLHGTARIFFQPNEEGVPSGAPVMIEEGVLEGLSAVFAVHVDPTLNVGQYGLIAGAATASADRFRIRVAGPSSGHSARPHQTVDTIWVATQIATQLYQLVGRVSDARNTAVLTICRFEGGHAYNVIPPEVEFGGTLRCIDETERTILKSKLIDMSKQVGRMHGAEIDVDYEDGAPPVINDPILIKSVAATITELYGDQAIVHTPRPSMGAEDFAYYVKYIPGALVRVGTASGPDTSYPLHDSRFDVDDKALGPAAQLMACVLISYAKRQAVKEAAAA